MFVKVAFTGKWANGKRLIPSEINYVKKFSAKIGILSIIVFVKCWTFFKSFTQGKMYDWGKTVEACV